MHLRERARAARAKGAKRLDGRAWVKGGIEPSTADLLADPIAILLMRSDRLTARDVEAVIRRARRHRRLAQRPLVQSIEGRLEPAGGD